ncbi:MULTISPECIES: hypothetical protein [Bradyrhizobium]|uniref:hypothetical protein n=1 Tax=Bradyrhizobium elkanii TaxID=29448 RepID=UPI00048A2FAD|nr:hypothetical protein [Bradyrhizobium elkanii]
MIADDKALDETRRMDRLLARQLKYGIWLASGVTALGMIVALFGRCIVPHGHTMTLGTSIVGKGIALIILLPILRVILAGLSLRDDLRHRSHNDWRQCSGRSLWTCNPLKARFCR